MLPIMRPGIPLRPDPSAVARAALASLARGCAIAAGQRKDPDLGKALKAQWADDRAALLVARSAVTPHATTDSPGLASAFVRAVLESLGPASAGAQVLEMGLQLNFDGAAAISVPGFVAAAVDAGFVAEGAPIPVRALSVSSPVEVLRPRKLALLTTLTSEMLASSNIEAMLRDVLMRNVGLALDAALFDSNAASAIRPAGLRNGIAALTASVEADPLNAMVADIATLVGAVSTVGAGGPYAVITTPARAATMLMRAAHEPEQLRVFASSAIATGDVIVLAPAALVSATGADVSVEASREAVVHMSDAAAALVGKATPPPALADVATPQRSAFQSDSIALKLRLPVAWLLRDTRALAWTTVTKW
jgi:hypothetical protein